MSEEEIVNKLNNMREQLEIKSNEAAKLRADIKLLKKQYGRLFEAHKELAEENGFEPLEKPKDDEG